MTEAYCIQRLQLSPGDKRGIIIFYIFVTSDGQIPDCHAFSALFD